MTIRFRTCGVTDNCWSRPSTFLVGLRYSRPLPPTVSSSERVRLSVVVFVVLFTQLLVYPGVDRLVEALGGMPTIDAGTAFLAVQLLAFVLFSAVWGVLSDRLGR